jgi:hypothetical protein
MADSGHQSGGDAFKAKGAKAVVEPRAIGKLWYAFFEDPGGVRVELLQRPTQ